MRRLYRRQDSNLHSIVAYQLAHSDTRIQRPTLNTKTNADGREERITPYKSAGYTDSWI
ncbi:exodeoxyribonuclease III Xth [Lactiplantibacillus plantarum]|nr:exodeoxyribonuclease III Xth [Lactiplantibacillus plantarum]